jgi:hypothetical protein
VASPDAEMEPAAAELIESGGGHSDLPRLPHAGVDHIGPQNDRV